MTARTIDDAIAAKRGEIFDPTKAQAISLLFDARASTRSQRAVARSRRRRSAASSSDRRKGDQ